MASRRVAAAIAKPNGGHNHDPSKNDLLMPMTRKNVAVKYHIGSQRSSTLRKSILLLGIVTVVIFLTMESIVVKMEPPLEHARTKLNHGETRYMRKHQPPRHSTTDSQNNKQKSEENGTKITTWKQQKKQLEKEHGNTAISSDKDVLEIYKTFDDPPILHAPISNANIKDFDPNFPGFVVVTKIQGQPHLRALRQMLCLFTQAYNNRAQRDVVVFTSEAIEDKEIQELQRLVAPSVISVVVDNPGLDVMVQALSEEQRAQLVQRCHVANASELTWYSQCDEMRSYSTLKGERIAYNWQAEFRALHLWTHEALRSYRYMMWMDSDAFCTRIWKQDPLAAAVRHDLVLLFDHFPQGKARGSEFPAITREAFDRTICGVQLQNGTLHAKDGRCFGKKKSAIHQVHGFFHVTNLDFYRSEPVMRWNKALIGDNKFSRLFDDQIGVTIPAAVLASNRSWDMKSLGIYPRVFHNYVIDGLMQDWRGYFVPWWNKNANTTFPEASDKCVVDISA